MKLLFENWRKYSESESVYGWPRTELMDMMMSTESPPDEEDAENFIDHKAGELRQIEEAGSTTVYRVVFAKKEEDIKFDKLGHHFISDVSEFHEGMLSYLWNNARKSDPTLEEGDAWLIEAKAPSDSIDYHETMRTFANFPFESEITVENPEKIEILSVSPYYGEE